MSKESKKRKKVIPTHIQGDGFLTGHDLQEVISIEGRFRTCFFPTFTRGARFRSQLSVSWVSLVAQMVKNLPVEQETQVQSLG